MRLTLLFTLFACAIQAQQLTDFNQIIAPLDSPAVDFKEYLVQLAWINSPEGRIAAEEVLNAKDRNSNTKKEWMRDIQATFNLNEGNLRQQNNASGNVFFPRYNFGATVNVFNILSQKDKNSIAKRDILIAEQKVNQRKYAIRAETLTRYAFFNMANSVLLSRRQVEQDTKSALVLIEQQYRSDEKSFDDFTTASSSFYQAQDARIRQENEVLQAQIRLEEIIGLMWVQVVHPSKI